MRVSIFAGLPMLLVGIGVSYLAKGLIDVQVATQLQSASTTIAAVLFVLLSAVLLGMGAGLVIHWIFTFANHYLAFVSEAILAFGLIFIGIGVAVGSGNVWTGVQAFFTFLTASIVLLLASFVTLFGGITQGIVTILKHVKRRLKRR